MVDDVHTFSPTVVGNLRSGSAATAPTTTRAASGSTRRRWASRLHCGQRHEALMPVFTMNDGFLSSNPCHQHALFRSALQHLPVVRQPDQDQGPHTLKFGGEHRVMDFTNLSWTASTGTYTFDNGSLVKADNSTSSSPAFGGSMAQFLLGCRPAALTRSTHLRRTIRFTRCYSCRTTGMRGPT